jgi:hypothetical protein
MNDSFVSHRHYQGIEGWYGQGGDVADLQKALTAGQDVTDPGVAAGTGFALRPESLETTLKITTYKMDDVKLWQALTKIPAYNTVEEFNQLHEYGSGVAAFIAEGDLPEGDDSTYERAIVKMKYMGTTRAVTHVMSILRPIHGSVIARETVNGTAWLLRQLERTLFSGDSSLIPVQFDGLAKIISASAPNTALNVVDLRGGPLTEDVINDCALIAKTEPNYGRATDLYSADGAFADLAKQFTPGQRFVTPPGGWTGGMVGMNIQGFYSQFGPIKFNPDTFLQFGPPYSATGVGDATKRPSTPTEDTGLAAAGTGSSFTADDAGDYFYKAAAINRYGRSAPLSLTGSQAVAAGESVTFTLADGAVAGTAFEIYRSDKDGAATTCKYMETVARSGATTVVTDDNSEIPGTSKAFLIQQNLDFFSFKQLAPFSKIRLATIDTSIRWMQLLYGALAVYSPGKGVVIKNVGRAPASAGLDNAALNSLLT